MEKKVKQKRPAQYSRMADDILNMNDGASKKRKQSLPDHLRPSILKKLKLKPNPTLLFSQFKPKESEENEINTSDVSRVAETSGSQITHSAKDSNKLGFSKGWTPPLKNAAPKKDYDDASPSSNRIGILQESNNVKKFEYNSKPEKTNGDANKHNRKNIGSEIASKQKQDSIRNTHGFAGMNSQDVDRKPFNDGSLHNKEIIHFEPSQDPSHHSDVTADSSRDNPYRNQIGIQSLLKAIDVIEANTELEVEIENSNGNESKDEVDVREVSGKQHFFKENNNELISSTPIIEPNSNRSLIMKHNPNHGGHIFQDEVIEDLTKKSYEYDSVPIEQFTDENTVQNDPSTELIDLTGESDEVQLGTLDSTVDSAEPVGMKTVVYNSVDEKLDGCADDCSLTSANVKYTETVIENLKSSVVCTIVNETRNRTEVLKFFGSDCSKNKNSRSDQADSVRESSTFNEHIHEKENDLIGTNDYVIGIEKDIDAADEEIMKEIRIYVYDSLTSSQKQEHENSNSTQYEENESETAGQVCLNDSMESQNSEKALVTDKCGPENETITNFDQRTNNDDSYVQETEMNSIVGEENNEEYEVRQTNEDCYDETETYQPNTSKEDNNYYQQNEDEKIEGKKVAAMEIDGENYMQKGEEENIVKYITRENNEENVCEEDDEQVNGNNEGEDSRSKIGDDQNELWIEDDDAFDEVIDMSCTQLIHIENEYSNKKKANENVGDHKNANPQKSMDLNIGKVQIPWVSDESKKIEKDDAIPHQSLQWVDRLGEEKQKLRAVVQELAKLNGVIQQARQKLWPSMKQKK